MIGNHLVTSTSAIRYGTRVRTQQDRRALSWFYVRCIFDHKTYSRKTENKYLLWFVGQTGALHNVISERVDAYLLISRYIRWSYNMVNHMLVVSRCFVRWTTNNAAHTSTPQVKIVRVKFLGKYRMNELRSKLIFIRFIFPSQWYHLNYCLWCSWCELKTTTTRKHVSLVRK